MPPRPPAPKAGGPPRPGASTPLDRTRSGKLKSKRAKVGGECSQAMSDWKTKGMTPAIAATLGKCRARARLQNRAQGHAEAGREGMAANLQRRAEGQYVTVKERLARAKELRAQRAGRQVQAASKLKPSTRAMLADRRVVDPRIGQRADGLTTSAHARKLAGYVAPAHDPRERPYAWLNAATTNDIGRKKQADRLARARELRAQRAQRQAPAGPKAEGPKAAPKAKLAPKPSYAELTQQGYRVDKTTPYRTKREAQEALARYQSGSDARTHEFVLHRSVIDGKPAGFRVMFRQSPLGVAKDAAMANARRRFGDSEAEIRRSTAETVRDFRKGKETYYTNYGSGGYGGKITREALGAPITAEIREKTSAVVARARELRAQRAARQAQAGPSVREQAAAHRAGKGTREERLDRLNERLFEAENYAWPGTRKMDILRRRHVKIMAARGPVGREPDFNEQMRRMVGKLKAARTASIAPQHSGVRTVPDRAGVREAADRLSRNQYSLHYQRETAAERGMSLAALRSEYAERKRRERSSAIGKAKKIVASLYKPEGKRNAPVVLSEERATVDRWVRHLRRKRSEKDAARTASIPPQPSGVRAVPDRAAGRGTSERLERARTLAMYRGDVQRETAGRIGADRKKTALAFIAGEREYAVASGRQTNIAALDRLATYYRNRGKRKPSSVAAKSAAQPPTPGGSLRQRQAAEKRAATLAKKREADAWNATLEDPAVRAARAAEGYRAYGSTQGQSTVPDRAGVREAAERARAARTGPQADPAARLAMAKQLRDARAAVRSPAPIQAVSDKQRAYAEDVRSRRMRELLTDPAANNLDTALGRLRKMKNVNEAGILNLRREAGAYLRRTRARRYSNLVQAGQVARLANAREILGR